MSFEEVKENIYRMHGVRYEFDVNYLGSCTYSGIDYIIKALEKEYEKTGDITVSIQNLGIVSRYPISEFFESYEHFSGLSPHILDIMKGQLKSEAISDEVYDDLIEKLESITQISSLDEVFKSIGGTLFSSMDNIMSKACDCYGDVKCESIKTGVRAFILRRCNMISSYECLRNFDT